MYTIVFFVFLSCLLLSIGLLEGRKDMEITCLDLSVEYTDALRGLAMIMIVFGHICGCYNESVWFSPFACTGVALFLFLSGYGNSESFKKKGKFTLSKILKIAIPYWILLLIKIVLNQEEFIIKDFFLDAFFIKTSYWFVGYIVKWYLVFWIASSFFYKYRWYLFSIFSLISFFYLLPLESEQSMSFIAGVAISSFRDELKKENNNMKINYCGIALFIFGIIMLGIKQLDYVRNTEFLMSFVQLSIKLPLALGIIILLRYFVLLRSNSLLLHTAQITYELYLIHMCLLPIINLDSSISVIITTLLVIILSVIIAIVFNKFNKFIINIISV